MPWTEAERQLFRYEDADGHPRFADPLVLDRRMANLVPDWSALAADANSDDDDRCERAMKKLRIAACAAFDLGQPLDGRTGEGVTDRTWLRVLNEFVVWSRQKKTTTAASPNSPPPTARAS